MSSCNEKQFFFRLAKFILNFCANTMQQTHKSHHRSIQALISFLQWENFDWDKKKSAKEKCTKRNMIRQIKQIYIATSSWRSRKHVFHCALSTFLYIVCKRNWDHPWFFFTLSKFSILYRSLQSWLKKPRKIMKNWLRVQRLKKERKHVTIDVWVIEDPHYVEVTVRPN